MKGLTDTELYLLDEVPSQHETTDAVESQCIDGLIARGLVRETDNGSERVWSPTPLGQVAVLIEKTLRGMR